MNYRNLMTKFLAIVAICGFSNLTLADGGDFSTSTVHFNLDACSSFITQGTNSDYSEFTASIDNAASCLQLDVVGGNLYRVSPMINPHSCTEGINGSNAMCVSSLATCGYDAGNMRSVKFDLLVTPGSDGTGTLSGLSFYEQAPETYSWIQGPTGLNNYPTQYGVRVLRDGAEIWRSEDNATTTGWTLESFSFTSEDFTVTSPATFTFEFLGYCTVGNGSTVTAWDLDEISVQASCGDPIDGGNLTLSGGIMNTSTCVGLGTSDPIETVLTGAVGPNSGYIITDLDGNILGLPTAPPFDFEGAGTGACLIWHASFTGTLTGLTVGANAADIEGCFDLSNSVRVDRFTADGGTISTPNGSAICATGNNLLDVSVSGVIGSSRLLITDLNGNILALPSGSPVDLSNINASECLVWNLGFNGNINGLAVGQNANNLTGTCFSLSNAISVSKTVVDPGVLSTNGVTFVNICEGNGTSNIINTTLNDVQGNAQLILTDANGNIINSNLSSPVDFSGFDSATYFIYNVAYDGNINGLTNGANINGLSGDCVGLSNSIEIEKESASGGTISSSMGSDFELCIEGVVSDPIDVSLSGAEGAFSRWVITDDNGVIIALPGPPPFNLDPVVGDVCNIWHLGFESSFTGLFLGQNVSAFTGCFGLSNSIRVTKRSSSAGRISANGGFTFIDVCGTGNQTVNVNLLNNFGENQTWVVSDPNGMILSVGGGPNFDFSSFPLGEYRINHISYFSGAAPQVGGNINTLTADCLDVSNQMVINKTDPVGGTISFQGGTSLSVCGDGQADNINVTIAGNQGGFMRWLVTDANGNILALPGNPPFNFEGLPEGVCFLWNLSFEDGISGLSVGANVSGLTGCASLSNSIEITKKSISPGSVSLPDGSVSIGICLEDDMSNEVDVVHSGANGNNGEFVITDDSGNILGVGPSFPFDFTPAGPGICRVYFVSYDDITGLQMGGTIAGLDGCFAVSNFVTVSRSVSNGGTISLDGGATTTTICVGEGTLDQINVNIGGTQSGNINRWIITDADGNILGLPSAPPFNFEGAGPGVCSIYNVNYSGSLTGLAMGANISDLEGCFDLSNRVTVNRVTIDNSSSTSTLTYNMNACNAQNAGTGGSDYTELTGIANNSGSCSTLSGGHIFRNNPTVNPHSCTPGLNGSTAVCVSSSTSCDFIANSDLAVRFDVTVDPAANGVGQLTSVSFYEAAPTMFNWINGSSGPNNYPTRYGIRVLKNGTEVFRQVGIATSNDFSLESFNFSNNPEFSVTTATTFSFELLGYCTAGINSTVTAWDIEDLVITSQCPGGLSGGDITLSNGATAGSTTIDVCVDDGINEDITVNLVNAAGPNMTYVITDSDLNILALPMSQPFNFEGVPPGVCLIWNLAFVDGLTGASVGANAANLSGCFSLSNPITVNRFVGDDCPDPFVSGGNLTSLNGFVAEELCVTDGESDLIDVQLTDAAGTHSAWVITNADHVIVDMPSGFPIDVEGSAVGTSYLYHISYVGALSNMAVGNELSMIEGLHAFSNALIINKVDCNVTESVRESIDRFPTDFSVYPNPANNAVTVAANAVNSTVSTVEVFDTFGQLVGSYQLTTKDVSIDLTEYPEGYYLVKVSSGGNSYSRSFIKI